MIAILAGQRLIERGAPALQRLDRRAGLVAQVVAIAHERVDRAHGVALGAREQQEGIVEVLGAMAGHRAAVCVGTREIAAHAALRNATRAMAPNRSRMRSPLEIAGRPESTS